MSENLKTTHYNNGDAIPNITNNRDWGSLSTGAYANYVNNPSNSEIYGRLYNWYSVDDDRGICPEGWHVPSDDEFTVLTDYLGGEPVAGGKMKEIGLEHWSTTSEEVTNESGFTAFGGGVYNGGYNNLNNEGYFSTSSTLDIAPYILKLASDAVSVDYGSGTSFDYGYSVRCIKD